MNCDLLIGRSCYGKPENLCYCMPDLKRGITDPEIKVSYVEDLKLSNVRCLKPRVSQNATSFASSATEISVFLVCALSGRSFFSEIAGRVG